MMKVKIKSQIDFEGYTNGNQTDWHVEPILEDSPNETEEPFIWIRFVDDATGTEIVDIQADELERIVRASRVAAKMEQAILKI